MPQQRLAFAAEPKVQGLRDWMSRFHRALPLERGGAWSTS